MQPLARNIHKETRPDGRATSLLSN